MSMDQAQIISHSKSPDKWIIALSGELNMDTISTIWDQCFKLIKEKEPKQLIIDAAAVTYCDSAGHALFQALEKFQLSHEHTFELAGLSEQLADLSHAIHAQIPAQIKKEKHQHRALRIRLGRALANFIRNAKENIVFFGMLLGYTFQLFTGKYHFHVKDMWLAAEDVGPGAFLIVAMIGFLIGLISTFQSIAPMERFGTQIFIINLVGLGVTREMGPLMAAVLLAGRTASSFAAELGTMKINQEIDALKTLGLPPVQFLVLPRVFGAALMTPVLSVFLILFAILGCAVVMRTQGFNYHIFWHQLDTALRLKDFIGGFIKAFFFGIVIASVGCLQGLKTKLGASAVGQSTTRAVVQSLIMLVIVDGIFAAIYYVLKV